MSIITMINKSASFSMIQCTTEHRKRTSVAPSLPFKTRSHRSRDHKAKVKARVRAKTKAKDKAQVKVKPKAANSRNQPNQNLHLSTIPKCINSTMKRPMLTIVAGSTR